MTIFNLKSIWDTITATATRFVGAVTSLSSVKDILDILFVAVIVYTLLVQMRKAKSMQIVKGFSLVLVIYIIVNLLQMNASAFIFNKLFGDLLVIVVIVFQGEIRQVLERVGQRRQDSLIRTFFATGKNDRSETFETINSVCRACSEMSDDKVGSLIIFQRNSLLGDITNHCVKVDAQVTSDMLNSIFFPKSAMHDGAVVISDNRIAYARCIVPLKNEKEISEHVGTRHRAAIEISLASDAVAVVTSEETGIISLAVEGKLTRNLNDGQLMEMLMDLLLPKDSGDGGDGGDSRRKRLFGRLNGRASAESGEGTGDES